MAENRALREMRVWFASPVGRALSAVEAGRLRETLPGLHAVRALQLGCVTGLDLLASCTAPIKLMIPMHADDVALQMGGATDELMLHAIPEALPIASDSIDLVILPHTLDFAADPHRVLREVERILVPGGQVVIIGFNPMSLLGLWRFFRRGGRRRRAPWCAHFLSLFRLKDWLKLLHFEPLQGQMLFYRPPIAFTRMLDSLHFMDKIGDRWWPMMGAVYLLVARQNTAGMTPLKARWRLGVIPGRALGEPVARSAVQGNRRDHG